MSLKGEPIPTAKQTYSLSLHVSETLAGECAPPTANKCTKLTGYVIETK